MEHKVQPQPGSHVNKLWKPNLVDTDLEPLYAPINTSNSAFVMRDQVKCDFYLILF